MSYNIIVEQQTTRMLVGGLVRVIDELEKENYTYRLHPKHPAFDDGKDLTEYYKNVGFVKEQEEDEHNTYDGAEDFSRRKTLTLAQYERLKHLNAAIRLGKQQKTIPKALLTKALNDIELKRIVDLYNTPHHLEILYGDGMPEVLKDYAEKVAKADFVYGQKEKLKPKTPRGWENQRRLREKAASLYESAIETLGETWTSADPKEQHEIQTWLDVYLEHDTFDNPDKAIVSEDGNVPRIRGTRSKLSDNDPNKSGLPKLSKVIKQKICVYTVLVEAAVELAFELPEPEKSNQQSFNTGEISSKLKVLLDSLNKDNLF